MKRLITIAMAGLILMSTGPSFASFTSINDWTERSDDASNTAVLFQVTMTFTSAAESGLAYNTYEYSVENLTTDLTANLFRVANPDNLPHDMQVLAGWSERVGAQNFIWEFGSIAPGATEGIFELRTAPSSLLPDLVNPPFAYNERGWIDTTNASGTRVDVFGPIVHVPVPGAVLLGILGLSVAGVKLRKFS